MISFFRQKERWWCIMYMCKIRHTFGIVKFTIAHKCTDVMRRRVIVSFIVCWTHCWWWIILISRCYIDHFIIHRWDGQWRCIMQLTMPVWRLSGAKKKRTKIRRWAFVFCEIIIKSGTKSPQWILTKLVQRTRNSKKLKTRNKIYR